MAQPATSWTGVAVVNGLMAVVLMVWLADSLPRSQIPEQPSTAITLDRAPERLSNRPINLPPPPTVANSLHDGVPADVTHLVSPMRPSTNFTSQRPIEIVPLRAVERQPTPAKALIPLEPIAEQAPPTTAESIHDGVPADVTHLVSPMRPSTNFTNQRPIEIVPLRAVERQPTPEKAPIPLEPVGKRARPSNSEIAATSDREDTSSTKSEVSSTRTEVVVNAEAIRTGRALLRVFEHGKGPQIDIAWPGLAAQRERLHDVLRRCFGMKLALMDRAGGLYMDAGPAGRTWPIDLDRFSGFVRRPNGQITPAERRVASRVARYHRRLPATDPIRLFPRATDAALLGGLARLLGDDYRSSNAITASYRLSGGRVTVDEIRVDGQPVVGKIDLTRGASTTCRRTGRT